MNGEDSAPQIRDLDELLEAREVTERISAFLNRRLKGHLAAMSPLLSPGRLLGKYVGARESAPQADQVLAELAEKYKLSYGSPFDLKPDLDEAALAAMGTKIEVYPFEYSYEAHGARASKKISMTSPTKWVVTYGSEYSLSQMRDLVIGAGERRSQSILHFVVNALAFQVTLKRSPGAAQLLNDLRYEIAVQPLPGLEKLPMVTVSLRVSSFRPPDDLMLTATRLSGVPAFIELIDLGAVSNLEDPLRVQIEGLARNSSA